MLQVWWQNHSLVTSLSRKLDPQVPGIEGDEGEFKILGEKVFLSEGVKSVDGVSERSCAANMLPCQGS